MRNAQQKVKTISIKKMKLKHTKVEKPNTAIA